MASGRFLSASIATDAQLAQLSGTAELLYLKCIPHLDRDGMITGNPMALLGMVAPMRFSEMSACMPTVIHEWTSAIGQDGKGLVIRFDTPHGPALFFKGFLKQQVLKRYDRERPSQFPAPPGYVRTNKGLVLATEAAWIEAPEPGQLSNANSIILVESPLQQQQEQQQQQQQEQEQQQQQQGAPAPATAAAAAEVRQELLDFGVTGKPLEELAAICTLAEVQGWIEYAETQERLTNPVGYVIKRLRSREPPPALPAAAEDASSYEALKRRYVPDGYDDIIIH